MSKPISQRNATCRHGAKTLLPVLLCIAGCATTGGGTVPPEVQDDIGEVLVVASAKAPQLEFGPLADHVAPSAAAAGLDMFADCLATVFGGSSCSGYICGAAVMVGFGVCGGAAIMAGGIDAAAAPKRAEVERAVMAFREAVDRQAAQDGLREQVSLNLGKRGEEFLPRLPAGTEQHYRHSGDLSRLAAAGVGAMLETDLARAGLERRGGEPLFLLSVRASARLLRTRDGSELRAREFLHTGGSYTAAQWSEDGSRRLLAGLAAAYEALGTQIFDSMLLQYPFPDAGAHQAGVLAVAFGLGPLHPPTRGQPSGDTFIGPMFEWFAVDSLRPELRWQAFPRAVDMAAAADTMGRVRNVRYDLMVAREYLGQPAQVVYRREGLAAPAHRLETALQPQARYFWSVRATFDLDGRRRVTAWSSVAAQRGAIPTLPNAQMFRFRTPG